MPAFDENYDTMSLAEFEPMVRRVMTKDFASKKNLDKEEEIEAAAS